MLTILHCISAYPDPIAPETQASSLLLELTADRFTHNVFSFKRAHWRGDITALAFDDAAGKDHRAMVYGAPPKGLRLARTMNQLATWIIADAQARGLKPDLVHAHKVTIDGLVGAQVAAHFGVPLALSVQANTDTRILNARWDLRATFRDIWQEAAVIFPFAPVAQTAVEALIGKRQGTVQMLPCPTRADRILTPTPRTAEAAPVIQTAFNLAHHGNKNIKTLLEATALAARELPDLRLDILGGGDAEAFFKISQMCAQIAPGHARLLGARKGDEMQTLMNRATAFALPSHRESFGMVYAEALLAGTPCLHSKGRAIDGLFAEGTVTLGVDPSNPGAMAEALLRLCREESAFKARLAEAQAAGHLNILRRHTIAERYGAHLQAAVDGIMPDVA
ncbi:glycosyltransferase [uncultured Sulfitobacter sp.]|uniref:glycosyltransferase n=1 Tax=uncultured Sulfitobacter sp. TaxID=191468 RepID=UPI0026154D69|nr:glycosyltransferase [uncultured Sulfitobacter sp.]